MNTMNGTLDKILTYTRGLMRAEHLLRPQTHPYVSACVLTLSLLLRCKREP